MPNEPLAGQGGGLNQRRRRGGRGRLGPLAVWLIANAKRIIQAEAEHTLYWADIAIEAAGQGVEIRPGVPYDRRVVSNTWGDLVRRGRIKGVAAPLERPDRSAPSETARTGDASAFRGQSGVPGTGGYQPPVPATPSPQPGTARPTSQGPEQPRRDARAMPRIRRPGDED